MENITNGELDVKSSYIDGLLRYDEAVHELVIAHDCSFDRAEQILDGVLTPITMKSKVAIKYGNWSGCHTKENELVLYDWLQDNCVTIDSMAAKEGFFGYGIEVLATPSQALEFKQLYNRLKKGWMDKALVIEDLSLAGEFRTVRKEDHFEVIKGQALEGDFIAILVADEDGDIARLRDGVVFKL